jgi:hypothetical protein
MRDELPNWNPAWTECFCENPKDFATPGTVGSHYEHLMKAFANEIGIH